MIAIDILSMEPVPGVDFVRLDFLGRTAPDKLKEMMGGPADVVLSDMAANATGHARTDHLKIMALVERLPNSPVRCLLLAVRSSQKSCKVAPRRRCLPP